MWWLCLVVVWLLFGCFLVVFWLLFVVSFVVVAGIAAAAAVVDIGYHECLLLDTSR